MNFTTIKIARDLSKTETFFMFAASCRNSLGYLASPFKSEKAFQPYKGGPEWVWRERATQTAIVTEWLLNNGIWVFSPIVYGMYIEETCGSHDSAW